MDPKIFQLLAIFYIQHLYAFEGAPMVHILPPLELPIAGYNIPVYIRVDNTPLEDINPELAEAFKSFETKKARMAANQIHHDGHSPNVLQVSEEGAKKINDKLAEESGRLGKEAEMKSIGKSSTTMHEKYGEVVNEPEDISVVSLDDVADIKSKNDVVPPRHNEPIYQQIPVNVQYQHIQKIPTRS